MQPSAKAFANIYKSHVVILSTMKRTEGQKEERKKRAELYQEGIRSHRRMIFNDERFEQHQY